MIFLLIIEAADCVEGRLDSGGIYFTKRISENSVKRNGKLLSISKIQRFINNALRGKILGTFYANVIFLNLETL